MTQDSPAFFTLDRGTASTRAALVAPVGGRYRLLAAATAPAAIDPESVLEDLAWRVARTDASVAGALDDWQGWSRLEVGSVPAARAVVVAAGDEAGELTARAFLAAGWNIAARLVGPDPDLVVLGEACLDPDVDAVVMAGRDGAEESERDAAQRLWLRVGALGRFRDDVALIACGPFAHRPEGIDESRLFSLPAPDPVPATVESMLRGAAQEVGAYLVGHGEALPFDSRTALRASVASLAGVLGSRVDGLEIGAAAGSRTVAGPEGEVGHARFAAAASLPPALLLDDEAGEAVLRWSILPGDPASRLDALRELTLHPWSGHGDEGSQLRSAALRAALDRLETAWAGGGERRPDAADVLVLSGGAFEGLPPAAAALAVVDTVRRPGAVAILHDHAGVLAPLGALPLEDDRRRLLVDLMDDCLLPLGSALLLGPAGGGPPAGAGSIHLSSPLGEEELPLEPGALRLVDVPPGISARLDIHGPAGKAAAGGEGRPLALDVRGGLAGLLVDTRPIPLELPEGGEARRKALAGWQAATGPGAER